MTSTLTWVDYDSEARDRSLRILSLFQQKESRDELGLGGIRDSFADMLFPGTSTIQTRLRYMLFVPWMYKALEARKISSREFAGRAAENELRLVQPLLESGDTAGVFGKVAGSSLQRLPSSVYWAGLGSWGIRVFDRPQDQYHFQIEEVYRRRNGQSARSKDNAQSGDDPDTTPDLGTLTWDSNLPACPDDFPETADFALTQSEALFIRDKITLSHPNSLLSWLALTSGTVDVSAPWIHPNLGSMSDRHKEILEHARRFSVVMHGASLIYNVLLSRLGMRSETEDKHTYAFEEWCREVGEIDLLSWSLDDLWTMVIDDDHRITLATRMFVQNWISMVRENRYGILGAIQADELIRNRETTLKRSQSRFSNKDALQQWGGASGLGRLNYRWETAQRFLNDLYLGLES